MKLKLNLSNLRLLGFDQARHIPFTSRFTFGCSYCSALSIQGVPCHEQGCPNATRECAGCSSIVTNSVKYCPDCRCF